MRSGLGWVCGARPRFFICAGSTHGSPSARDPRTILPLRGPCLAKEASWRRPGDPDGQRFSLPVERSAPRENHCPPTARDAPTDAGFCLRVLKPERCCVHDGIRPRTQHPSTPHARTQNLASPRATLREPNRARTRPPVEALSENDPTRCHSDAGGTEGPTRPTQDPAFACVNANDAAFATGSDHERSILRPLTHERRILRPSEPCPESPPDPGPDRRSRLLRRAGPPPVAATQQQSESG